jgi:arabinogalactan oligomer/maltooligosaccharide transport system permease protein
MSLWNRLTAAVVTGLLILAALGGWLVTQARDDVRAKAHAASSLAAANALAAVLEATYQAGEADPAAMPDGRLSAATERFAEALTQDTGNGLLARVVDIERRWLITSVQAGSTDTGGAIKAEAPRALQRDEKPLYDRGVALRSNVLTNFEEDRSARPTRELKAWATGALALAPLTVDGRVLGYVEVVLTPTPPPPPSLIGHAALIGLVLLVLGLSYAASRFLGRRESPTAEGKPAKQGWQAGVVALALVAALSAVLWTRGPASIARSEARATTEAVTLIERAGLAATAAEQESGAGLAVLKGEAGTSYLTDAFGASLPLPAPTGVSGQADLSRSLLASAGLAFALAAFVGFGAAAAMARGFSAHRTAYLFLIPAILGMILLSIFPFLYGVGLSFTDTTLFNQDKSFLERFVGLANYADVLIDFDLYEGEVGSRVLDYTNFYWTLFMTVVWTVSNVVIGVSLGLGLALLLNIKGLRGVGIYRTLLILPWALPNYITALTWKGIFHPQFGAANEVIQAFGGDPVRWFDSVWPSFFTGLATNGWLSFPFMMVVCLGALQAVDEEMYEAAKLDGAGPWSRFRHITLPSLQSTLMPAIVVSVVWTFNMFNVIYLVSAGQPGGATEILVTRAYKLAFEDYRYGYAAAYSVVIFLLLLVYGWAQVQASLKAEAKR